MIDDQNKKGNQMNAKTEAAQDLYDASGGKQLAEVKPTSLGVQLKEKQANFTAALPAHIPAERFARVILTAVQNNPELARADRSSLWNACMRAAQDGLLPDGREGALVIYNTKIAGEWIAKVSWMPMIAGIRKKVRNSNTIATWDVYAVHARDTFTFELGDDPYIKHRPYMPPMLTPKDGESQEDYSKRASANLSPGPLIAAYSVALLKSGERTRDVMTRAEIEYVRDTYSKRDRNGSFSPAWTKSFDEMAKKTVARRHSKVLPMSSDLDDLMRRDDELYDMGARSDKQLGGPAPDKDIGARVRALVNGAGEAEDIPSAEDAPEGDTISGAETEKKPEAQEQKPADKKPEKAASNADKKTDTPRQEPEKASGPETPQAAPPTAESIQTAASGAENRSDEATSDAHDEPTPEERAYDELLATGAARAESGTAALLNFLNSLEDVERQSLAPATVKAWRETARGVDAKPKAAKPRGAK